MMAVANSESKQKAAEVKQKQDKKIDEISTKIADAYAKLAAKFRDKAERAAKHLEDAKSDSKRKLHRRRFELYGDAATDLDERVRLLKGGSDNGVD